VHHLDTAYNYLAFGSHRRLVQVARDLLPQFAISTKVGFFRSGNGAYHSVEPIQLRDAIWHSINELGVRPAVIFLHSPERTLADLRPRQAGDVLQAACFVLAEATAFGLCDRWGIASWEPAGLLPALSHASNPPTPDLLMVRAGLSLDAVTLDAAERLTTLLGITPANRWGMSPFAGSPADPAWHTTDLAPFLEPDQPHTSLQAAYRLAYELPKVIHMAVGTDNPAHLRELVAATQLAVSADGVDRYRQLISTSVMAAPH
jgi:aryl-alcohol dehydrogenase-like predicted oxidoreductase